MKELNFFVRWVTIKVYKTILHHYENPSSRVLLKLHYTHQSLISIAYALRLYKVDGRTSGKWWTVKDFCDQISEFISKD